MSITLSERVQRVKPSPTLAVAARAAELRRAGKDVIGLGTGEPDFDTPEHIKQAAIEAINAGFTKYTPVDGIPELKEAICNKFKQDNQLDYEPSQILVSCGGKQSFYNLAQAYLNDGDEVIIPAPYWVSYPDMAKLAGAVPVIVSAGIDQNYKITAEQLAKAITPKTRLFVMNSPSNPSGMSYSKKELHEIAQVLLKHPNILIATDDMYEHILWTEEPFVNIVNVCPELYERTVVLNGVSKAYAMTGWRIGYAGGPANLIGAMKKVQSQSTSNPSSISQKAAVAAIAGPQDCMKAMLAAFKKRHDHVIKRIETLPHINCKPADGTFYLFPNVENIIERIPSINNDVEFTEFLLQEAEVALVPGTAFGAPGSIRLSFACSMETMDEALDRIARVIPA